MAAVGWNGSIQPYCLESKYAMKALTELQRTIEWVYLTAPTPTYKHTCFREQMRESVYQRFTSSTDIDMHILTLFNLLAPKNRRKPLTPCLPRNTARQKGAMTPPSTPSSILTLSNMYPVTPPPMSQIHLPCVCSVNVSRSIFTGNPTRTLVVALTSLNLKRCKCTFANTHPGGHLRQVENQQVSESAAQLGSQATNRCFFLVFCACASVYGCIFTPTTTLLERASSIFSSFSCSPTTTRHLQPLWASHSRVRGRC